MSRSDAIPTDADIAFAKARRKRVTGEVPTDDVTALAVPAVSITPGTTSIDSTQLAALLAEMAELRSIVMSRGKAPTDARRVGDVADAEMASEVANELFSQLIDVAKANSGVLAPKEGVEQEKFDEALARVNAARQQVDIARCMAGIIPPTHPGLRLLPANHPVFARR